VTSDATRPPGDQATGARVSAALADAATIGPFFALGTRAAARGWRPAAACYRPGPDGFLARAIARLPAGEPRVAASIAQQAYAARLWSPVLASALLHAVVPDLTHLQVHTPDTHHQVRSPDPASPLALALDRPAGWPAPDLATAAELSYQVVVTAHLEPLALALSGEVADGLLWGNAASALAGALGVLIGARPAVRAPATALATALLGHGRLADTGELGVTSVGLGFRRHSCCLYYRLPGGALCGDCALARPPS
jgi:ferric iron reductase protein FhuF